MRSRSEIRVGAAGMGLLLQVFLFSMLLHPCCLGLQHEDGSGAPGVSLAEASPAGGHGAHDAPGEGSPHGNAGHVPASGEHTHEGGDDGCGGACGLCCQSVGADALPDVPVALDAVPGEGGFSSVAAPRSVRIPTPSYLLPFSNGPPLSASFLT